MVLTDNLLKGIYKVMTGLIYASRRAKQLCWPTVVVSGMPEIIRRPVGLSPEVLGGFQSAQAITLVNVERADVSDYVVKAEPGRQFTLLLQASAPFSQQVNDLKRGLAAIATDIRANFYLICCDVRHTLASKVLAITGWLQIYQQQRNGLLTSEEKFLLSQLDASLFQKELDQIFQLSRESLADRAVDQLVTSALQSLRQIRTDSASILPHLEILNESPNIDFDQGIVAAQQVIPRLVAEAESRLIDLGLLDVLEPISLKEIHSLFHKTTSFRDSDRACEVDNPELLSCNIIGNRHLLEDVFAEIFVNVQRATGAGEAGFNPKLVRIGLFKEKQMLRISVTNKVVNDQVRTYLEENEEFLLGEIKDGDAHGKQGLFKRGVSSKKQAERTRDSGGIGLDLLWNYVVLKLKGEIHADYHPEKEEFTLSIILNLA